MNNEVITHLKSNLILIQLEFDNFLLSVCWAVQINTKIAHWLPEAIFYCSTVKDEDEWNNNLSNSMFLLFRKIISQIMSKLIENTLRVIIISIIIEK